MFSRNPWKQAPVLFVPDTCKLPRRGLASCCTRGPRQHAAHSCCPDLCGELQGTQAVCAALASCQRLWLSVLDPKPQVMWSYHWVLKAKHIPSSCKAQKAGRRKAPKKRLPLPRMLNQGHMLLRLQPATPCQNALCELQNIRHRSVRRSKHSRPQN